MTYQITSIPSVFGFNDLGTGTVYGSRVYTAADGANSPAHPEGTSQSITLDVAGISAIVSNTTFGIGGRITTLGAKSDQRVRFRFLWAWRLPQLHRRTPGHNGPGARACDLRPGRGGVRGAIVPSSAR